MVYQHVYILFDVYITSYVLRCKPIIFSGKVTTFVGSNLRVDMNVTIYNLADCRPFLWLPFNQSD